MKPSHDRSRRAFVGALSGVSLLSLADTAFAQPKLALASGGRPLYSILLPASTSPSEKWAAQELRLHLKLMTGADFPIAGAAPNGRVIAIGQNAVTEAAHVDPPEGESFVLKTAGDAIVIAGGRGRGTLYGVYALLEKLGCRWFTADVARVPKAAELYVSALDERHTPVFQYREVYSTEALGKEWSARNRLNGHFHHLDASTGGKFSIHPFAHSFYDLVPPPAHFSSHPEYFALVAGRRREERAQLCLTNPEVVRLSVDRVRQWIADDPEASAFSVSQNDGGGWCECGPCRSAIAEEGGAVSGLLLRFVNGVAEQIAASHPGRTIDTLAYLETFDPPSRTRPRPNVSVRLCPMQACQAHSYFTCPYNAPVRQALAGWARIAPKLYLWIYSADFSHYLMPFPNFDELATDIPKLAAAGVSGVFVEGAGSGEGRADDAELRSYIAARLLWDPQTKVEAEIRAFHEAVYGPAAPAMGKYFALQHREVRGGQHLWFDQDVSAPSFPTRALPEARALLVHAREQAVTPAARKRIDAFLLSLDYVTTVRSWRFQVRDGAYAPADLAAVRARTQSLVAKAKDLGLVQFREGYELSRQASDIEALIRSYPAVSLSDGKVTAAVVPDLEARVVRVVRSGETENALRVADVGEWAYPRAGGLFPRLYPDYLGIPIPLAWRVRGAVPAAVTLDGASENGLILTLVYRVSGGVLTCEVSVENQTGHDAPVALRWQVEVPLRQEPKPDQITVPAGEVTLGRTRIRFRPEQAGHCRLIRSFQDEARAVWSLWSPETVLASGRRLSLSSELAV